MHAILRLTHHLRHNLPPWLKSALRRTLTRALTPPRFCLLCNKVVRDRPYDLCAACEAQLPFSTHSPRADGVDDMRALFRYEAPINEMIARYKYQNTVMYADLFSKMMAANLTLDTRIEAIVPIPLHPNRLKKRGYNQAALIARRIAHLLNLPYAPDLLLRRKDTVPQVGLSKSARQQNMRAAFAIPTKRTIPPTGILLIDDVTSTQSTLISASTALKRAYPTAFVAAWTVAHGT